MLSNYGLKVLAELLSYDHLTVGDTVEECVEELADNFSGASIYWGCLETEPGLLAHVVSYEDVLEAEYYLSRNEI